jgi:hypothetical protein
MAKDKRWREAVDRARERAEIDEKRMAVVKVGGIWDVVPAYLKDHHKRAYGRKS